MWYSGTSQPPHKVGVLLHTALPFLSHQQTPSLNTKSKDVPGEGGAACVCTWARCCPGGFLPLHRALGRAGQKVEAALRSMSLGCYAAPRQVGHIYLRRELVPIAA